MDKSGKSFFRTHVVALILIAALGLSALVFAWRHFPLHATPQPSPPPSHSKPDPARRTLRVMVAADHEPYSFLDAKGEPFGRDVDLARILAECLDMNASIRLAERNEARRNLVDGAADLLLGLEYQPNLPPELNLSLPFQNDPFLAFGVHDFAAISRLYSARIAVSDSAGQYGDFLNSYRLREKAAVYPSAAAAFQSVVHGENDYVIARHSIGRLILAQMGDTPLRAVGPPLANNYACVAVNRADPGLLERVNAAIIALEDARELDRLETKWLGPREPEPGLWSLLADNSRPITVVLGLVVVMGMLLYMHSSRRLLKNTESRHENLLQILEYQQLLSESTRGLYESIHEFDITHNRAVGESAAAFFQNLGMGPDTPFDEAVRHISRHFIKEEHRQGYLDLFLRENVLAAYQNGARSLVYELLNSSDGENYYWLRITARISHWQLDDSVRMIAYRQNIDAEKKHEMRLLEKLRLDPMTNLYNKAATEKIIAKILSRPGANERKHALAIVDIDSFKAINDTFGHAFGDHVINHFAAVVRKQFRESDIVGRIGGDEFAIFLPNIPGGEWMAKQARSLVDSLCQDVSFDEKSCHISASVGIALYPESGTDFATLYRNADSALYFTKRNGKNNFTVHAPDTPQRSKEQTNSNRGSL